MEPPTESLLDRARRHVALCEACVQQQRDIVAVLRMHGHDAAEAERLLESLEQTLSVLREALAAEEAPDMPMPPDESQPRSRL